MSTSTVSNREVFFTGSDLLAVGASEDKDGVRWIPPDQMVRENDGSVALRPDPESLRVYFAKRATAFAGKAKPAVSGPQTKPAGALNRMMERPGVKRLMGRLQQRGLIPREPNNYATLKQPVSKMAQAPKPHVTALSIRRMALNLLHTRPVARAGLKLATAMLPEPAARIVSGAAMLLGPKPGRRPAYNFG
jgi:hypothetical protein